MFTSRHEHRVIDAGHNLPQEAPAAFADAVPDGREVVAAFNLRRRTCMPRRSRT
jgi:hypothetical protein